MKKKVLSIVLALALCLGLLPGTAVAAETDLPEWHFLWAIFKNVDADGKDQDGVMQRAKYTMPQEQIDYVKKVSQEFEEYMNQVGVMRARVEVVVIDETITELGESLYGACLSPKQAAPLLEKSNINLDLYDEVICVVSLNGLKTDYYGLGGSSFENRTGWAAINLINWEYCSNVLADSVFRSGGYVHEFLHFMENISKKWGGVFDIHDIRINFYTPDHDGGKACYMDIMRNCAKGNAGTGVPPAAWQYPPRVLRTIRELDIPFGVASIGNSAFAAHPTLTKVTVPGSVASIEYGAFQDCAGLKEVTFSSGLTQIG